MSSEVVPEEPHVCQPQPRQEEEPCIEQCSRPSSISSTALRHGPPWIYPRPAQLGKPAGLVPRGGHLFREASFRARRAGSASPSMVWTSSDGPASAAASMWRWRASSGPCLGAPGSERAGVRGREGSRRLPGPGLGRGPAPGARPPWSGKWGVWLPGVRRPRRGVRARVQHTPRAQTGTGTGKLPRNTQCGAVQYFVLRTSYFVLRTSITSLEHMLLSLSLFVSCLLVLARFRRDPLLPCLRLCSRLY